MPKRVGNASVEAVVFYTFLKIIVLKSSKNLGVSEKKPIFAAKCFILFNLFTN